MAGRRLPRVQSDTYEKYREFDLAWYFAVNGHLQRTSIDERLHAGIVTQL